MSVRLQVAALIFMMVQGFLFGVGTILVLATPLSGFAMQLMPWVIGLSAVISLPMSWLIAPRLMVGRRERGTIRPQVGDHSRAHG